MRNRFHNKGHFLALFDRASDAPRELPPRGELMRRRRKVIADPQVAHRIDWNAYHSSIQAEDFVLSQDNSLIKFEPNQASSHSRGRIVNRFGNCGMSKRTVACRKPDLRGVAKLSVAGPPWNHLEAPHAELTQQCRAESLRFQVFRNSLFRHSLASVHRGSGVESAKRT